MYRTAERCQRHVVTDGECAKRAFGTAVLTLLVALIQLYPAAARACSCLAQSPAEAFEQAVSVFEGHVLEIKPVPATPETSGQTLPQLAVRLSVVRSWKGMEQEQIVLTTGTDSAACGFAFAVDQDYLVYASSGPSGLTASLCSRTALIADATEDIGVLGMGATPVDPHLPKAEQDALAKPKSEPPASGGCASCAVLSAANSARGGDASALSACVALTLITRRVIRRRRSASRS
jgi:hypothetical protein